MIEGPQLMKLHSVVPSEAYFEIPIKKPGLTWG